MKEKRSELNVAHQIQQGLLPPDVKIEHVHFYRHYQSMSEVGGDFFDIVHYAPGRFGVFIADVSGHGTAAAFIGALTKMALTVAAKDGVGPADVLQSINASLVDMIRTDHYVTAFYAIVDLGAQTIVYSRAGHPAPLLLHKDGSSRRLDTKGFFLGAFANTNAEEHQIPLSAGDRMVLFTDGCFELTSTYTDRVQVCYQDFERLLIESGSVPVDDLFSTVDKQLRAIHPDFTRRQDDVTFLALEFD